ncbi:MAG: hypothetical protein OCD02_01075 [Spirochaetaceae bacterium]
MKKLVKYYFSKKFMFFILGGGVSYFLKALISYLYSEFTNFGTPLVYGLTLPIVICYNFFYNVLVTFKVKGGLKGRFLSYLSFVLVFNLIDYFFVLILSTILSIHLQISIFLVTGFLMIVKFFVFDKWVFHKKILRSDS